MISELVVATAGAILVYNWDKISLKNKWKKIMLECKLYNPSGIAFSISKINNKNYGYSFNISIPLGLSLDHLIKKKDTIQDNFNCILKIEKGTFDKHIKAYLINKNISKYIYKPVKCKPNLIYIGTDITGKNYFIDLNKDPHVLLGGATGTGKSFFLAMVLANIIYCNSELTELWLMQTTKGELGMFQDCSNVRCYGRNFLQVVEYGKRLESILEYRSKKFEQYGIKNITQWNKHFPNKKMKRIIVATEEMYSISCIPSYAILMKAGRSVGIHVIGTVQRSTVANLSGELKAQMARIAFRLNGKIDSQNIIDCDDATKLKERECLVKGNSGLDKVIVPYIDEDYMCLHEYVPNIRVPNSNSYEEKESEPILDDKIQPKVVDVEFTDCMKNNTEIAITKPVDTSKKQKIRKGVISLKEINK